MHTYVCRLGGITAHMVYVAGRLKVIEESMGDPESARQAAQLASTTLVCELTNILQAAT